MTLYKKKLLTNLLFGYGGLMLLLIGMLSGSMLLSSNVLYMDTPVVQILDIAITIVDIFAYAISASVIIYGIYLFGAKSLTTVYAAYFCITVFHYVTILCIGWLVFPNTLPESVQDLIVRIFEDLVLFVALDCLRIFLIGLITAKLFKSREAKRKEYNAKAKILGKETQDERSIAFPLNSFISFKNPVQLGIFSTAIIYWLTFYFQYIYIDILSLLKFEYVEGLGMQIIYLLLNAVLACICYCIMMFIMMKYDEKMPKTQ